MNFTEFILQRKYEEVAGTFIYRFAPKKSEQMFHFLAGQYTFIQNPHSNTPKDARPFSIASCPEDRSSLEFCIKVYGQWTNSFSQLVPGQKVLIAGPRGDFIWDSKINDAVFLLGGLGISPIISLLRSLTHQKFSGTLTLIYGNRTPETIAYNTLLSQLQHILPLKIVHVFSDIPSTHPWEGYRGFITRTIVEAEVDLLAQPTFFSIGPPIFVAKMLALLKELQVAKEKIKTENLSLSSVSKK
jgi:ferredoxin-NADP reductase